MLRLEKGETFDVHGSGGPISVTRYDLIGIDLDPEIILLDSANNLFADVDASSILVRAGYEGEEKRLRDMSAAWSSQRFVKIEHEVAHHYRRTRSHSQCPIVRSEEFNSDAADVRAGSRARSSPPSSPPIARPTPGETTIDGAGGTLIAGMYEMHAHLGPSDGLLNVMAGVTTVRDMGNDNAVLDELIEQIDSGTIGGPHVIRSGFIEGKSPFSANNGILVDSQEKAVDAVRWYGARNFWQIKIYNSMTPAWVPAMTKEAHLLGMRVAGHIPAFSNADAMIEAGYDEITHINQFALGWVIQPNEDTRTLFRLTALKRLPALDLQSPKVQHTIDMMVERKIAIDPTLGIHEQLTQRRDGKIPPGAVDYFDHMPIGWRRDNMKALVGHVCAGRRSGLSAGFRQADRGGAHAARARCVHRLRHRHWRFFHLSSRAGTVPTRGNDAARKS